ncbi:hypothetical protein QYF36_010279 [Acer negundo]|nr:hypothetical protein QYF36_010279 [Acer negundo]
MGFVISYEFPDSLVLLIPPSFQHVNPLSLFLEIPSSSTKSAGMVVKASEGPSLLIEKKKITKSDIEDHCGLQVQYSYENPSFKDCEVKSVDKRCLKEYKTFFHIPPEVVLRLPGDHADWNPPLGKLGKISIGWPDGVELLIPHHFCEALTYNDQPRLTKDEVDKVLKAVQTRMDNRNFTLFNTQIGIFPTYNLHALQSEFWDETEVFQFIHGHQSPEISAIHPSLNHFRNSVCLLFSKPRLIIIERLLDALTTVPTDFAEELGISRNKERGLAYWIDDGITETREFGNF